MGNKWTQFAAAAALVGAAAFLILAGCASLILVRDRGPAFISQSHSPDDFWGLAQDRRVLRSANVDGRVILCAEGVKEPSYLIQTGGKDAVRVVPIDPDKRSLAVLREGAWQLCNAYSNGVLTKNQYAAALSRLLLPAPASVDAGFRKPNKMRKKPHHKRHA